MENNNEYVKHYDEEKFFKKLGKFAKKIGAKIVYYLLILFYTLQDPSVPAKYKIAITGALGYFILPFDFVPDMAPVAGHVDDMSMIVSALVSVLFYINPSIKAKARQKMKDIFGNGIEKEIDVYDEELEAKKQ